MGLWLLWWGETTDLLDDWLVGWVTDWLRLTGLVAKWDYGLRGWLTGWLGDWLNEVDWLGGYTDRLSTWLTDWLKWEVLEWAGCWWSPPSWLMLVGAGWLLIDGDVTEEFAAAGVCLTCDEATPGMLRLRRCVGGTEGGEWARSVTFSLLGSVITERNEYAAVTPWSQFEWQMVDGCKVGEIKMNECYFRCGF